MYGKFKDYHGHRQSRFNIALSIAYISAAYHTKTAYRVDK